MSAENIASIAAARFSREYDEAKAKGHDHEVHFLLAKLNEALADGAEMSGKLIDASDELSLNLRAVTYLASRVRQAEKVFEAIAHGDTDRASDLMMAYNQAATEGEKSNPYYVLLLYYHKRQGQDLIRRAGQLREAGETRNQGEENSDVH